MLEFAKNELQLRLQWLQDLGIKNNEDPEELKDDLICEEATHEDILKIVEVVNELQVPPYALNHYFEIVKKIHNGEPLSPLTGEDDEWLPETDGREYNKRCSRVFRENGKAYYMHGKVFLSKGGAAYTNRNSIIEVEFPYMLKTEYIVMEDE